MVADDFAVTASPSSRRAWIEIETLCIQKRRTKVALLAEGVDRNAKNGNQVDVQHVALLAEGVDRNGKKVGFALDVLTSPSSRRAWIEIPHNPTGKRHHAVALLAEGAGRNRHKNMVNSY